jgi:hypothetical protein
MSWYIGSYLSGGSMYRLPMWQQQAKNARDFGFMVSSLWDYLTWPGRVVLFPFVLLLMVALAIFFCFFEVGIAGFKWAFIKRDHAVSVQI